MRLPQQGRRRMGSGDAGRGSPGASAMSWFARTIGQPTEPTQGNEPGSAHAYPRHQPGRPPEGTEGYGRSGSYLAEGSGDGPLDLPDGGGTAEIAYVGGVPLDVNSPLWRRHYARQLIRAFLRSVPRTEPDAPLVFPRPDGSDRLVTRAQLTAAVDR